MDLVEETASVGVGAEHLADGLGLGRVAEGGPVPWALM